MRLAALAALLLTSCVEHAAVSFESRPVSRAVDEAIVSLRGELLCIESRPLLLTPARATFPHQCVELDDVQLASIAKRYGYSAVVGIAAHEFGHVVAYNRSGDLSQGAADYWAGCAMARRGYWPDAYMAYLTDEEGYDAARDEATRRGWAECR